MKISIPFIALALTALSPVAYATQADDTAITITGKNAGPTPFISKVTVRVSDPSVLDRIQFAITPKPGSVTRPLSATYTKEYLKGRGYVDAQGNQITVPVFGLYAGYTNEVGLKYFFADGSSKNDSLVIATTPFDDACDFNTPVVLQPRTATTKLSYDFILVASSCSPNSPTVIDTDGAVRWVGTSGIKMHQVGFFDNAVYQGNETQLLRMELDGEVSLVADYAGQGIRSLHHNFDPGKYGIILDARIADGLHIEIDFAGRILKRWDLREIVTKAMIAGGDNPNQFVPPLVPGRPYQESDDWTHNNSVAYRKSDDSIIISSRENFVICLDYETGAIKWILGDTTKEWHQYPSLRKFALSLAPGGIAPAGQYSVSITHDDHLLLFDNGEDSDHHEAQPGVKRLYSAVRKYKLDLQAKVATEVWNFTRNETVKAPYCSSAYEDAPANYLVDYANAKGFARILGLAASGQKVFEYAYPTDNKDSCDDAFRSIPVHWEGLQFPTPTDVRLANLSARSLVTGGDSVAIVGFIVSGPVEKKVVLRGLGPSLPLNGSLENPRLDLYNSDNQILKSNDDYKNGPDAAEISGFGLAPKNDNEAAILAELPPGVYTAILRGVSQTSGIGLVEIFDVDAKSTSKLGNLSARAFTGTGDNVLIGGVIVVGTNPKRVVFRAIGPALADFGVDGALEDPTLDLFGADGTKISSNDNWKQAPNAAAIEATGLAPTKARESAIMLPVPAGAYTFIVRGKQGTQGIALVEAYQLD